MILQNPEALYTILAVFSFLFGSTIGQFIP